MPFSPLPEILEELKLGKPILFVQERPGLNGTPFRLRKFRTMIQAGAGELPDSARLDPFGKRLRSASLDELPQLLSVVRGDMSLIGPRPLLMRYLPRYSPVQARRHLVKPGLTGWSQINGRNAMSWEDKLALDVWYVDNWSLFLDLKILLRTPAAVLGRRGVSAEGEATTVEFFGSD